MRTIPSDCFKAVACLPFPLTNTCHELEEYHILAHIINKKPSKTLRHFHVCWSVSLRLTLFKLLIGFLALVSDYSFEVSYLSDPFLGGMLDQTCTFFWNITFSLKPSRLKSALGRDMLVLRRVHLKKVAYSFAMLFLHISYEAFLNFSFEVLVHLSQDHLCFSCFSNHTYSLLK